MDMFFDIGRPIADVTNGFIDWLIVNYGDVFASISRA